ncbi:DNA-directed RNA polymerase, RBP11-like dimerization domain [Pseudocohnilembus persalinus]|uniref:DNA-directed RNA polymerase, RBP11-like dimerization domain n=1 Tax=Pseudocohnilembus persalinus TaxID=266149 RepID=A0A0V0R9G6_PSEPJ|nr:DNA-directed RNA polymerase, RBP11-like dimerization domain [Pseudocohnilembus persalinus]|eukprot:KRX11123.1 DNA-directed RNA polymerase, RBP11-like dimerization domain [Pseudocohnilembus persalinus]
MQEIQKSEIKENFREKVSVLYHNSDRIKYMQVREESQKISNALTFILYLEDHTIGNVLRMELMNNKQVKFAGYKVPHPLEDKVEIRVQTTNEQKPKEAVDKAITDLKDKLSYLENQFEQELKNFQP